MEFGKSATNFDSPPAESCPNGRQNAELPKLSALFGTLTTRGRELRVLRVREHPLNVEVHPLTAKSTPSK